jgi:MFS transporter, PHS family, inorganic phosphate transporter
MSITATPATFDPKSDGPISRRMLEQLDDAPTSREHWKIMFISGMGFFTDPYDLFVIGVVATLVTTQ